MIGKRRIVIANRNIPGMVGQITEIPAGLGININDMLNRSKGNNAYDIIDIDGDISDESVEKIRAVSRVTMVRVI